MIFQSLFPDTSEFSGPKKEIDDGLFPGIKYLKNIEKNLSFFTLTKFSIQMFLWQQHFLSVSSTFLQDESEQQTFR